MGWKALGVSGSTVRRDLEALDQAGSVKRTHGGAVYSSEMRALPALEDRLTTAAEKRAIGRATAALLDDGDMVLLGGGTTGGLGRDEQ
ncbi:MAG TPA: DeoR family transcriptional regulator [Isosphaeraceae bacterium]|nr:DeoR family transcriptional regulator [Isosphaeraceae bacterium]